MKVKFKYTICWVDNQAGRSPKVTVDDPNIAMYIAKKKVADGMESVIINVSRAEEGMEDETFPAIEVED